MIKTRKKRLRKAGMTKVKDIYIDGTEAVAFGKKDSIFYKRLKHCYMYDKELPINEFEFIYKNDTDIITPTGLKFFSYFYLKAKILLKNNNTISVVIPTKIAPLILETKNYFVTIAPTCVDPKFESREGFVEISGCKCEKQLDSLFDKNGRRKRRRLAV